MKKYLLYGALLVTLITGVCFATGHLPMSLQLYRLLHTNSPKTPIDGEALSQYLQQNPRALSRVHLENRIINNLTLSNITLPNVNFEQVTFNHAKLTNVTFDGGTLTGSEFHDSQLKSVTFEGTNLKPLDKGYDQFFVVNTGFYHSLMQDITYHKAVLTNVTQQKLLPGSSIKVIDSQFIHSPRKDKYFIDFSSMNSLLIDNVTANDNGLRVSNIKGLKSLIIKNSQLHTTIFSFIETDLFSVFNNKNSNFQIGGKFPKITVFDNKNMGILLYATTDLALIKNNTTGKDSDHNYNKGFFGSDIEQLEIDKYPNIKLIFNRGSIDNVNVTNTQQLGTLIFARSHIKHLKLSNASVNEISIIDATVGTLDLANIKATQYSRIHNGNIQQPIFNQVSFLPSVKYSGEPNDEAAKIFWQEVLQRGQENHDKTKKQ